MKSLNWRLVTIITLAVVALYSAMPTFIYFSQSSEVKANQELLKSKIPNFLPQKYVNLGLDLQGGVQLVLGINVDEAVENKLGRIGTEVLRWAKENNQGITSSYIVKGEQKLRVDVKNPAEIDNLRVKIKKEFPGIVLDSKGANNIDFRFDETQLQGIKESALEQTERVVRTRVDKWGVAEPLIARRADKTVLVQLPGFSDPKKAKELLGRTALLKFQIVDDEFSALSQLDGKLPEGIELKSSTSQRQNTYYYLESEDGEAIKKIAAPLIPADRQLLLERQPIADGKKSRFISYVVMAGTELTGEDILDAHTGQSSRLDGAPEVILKFTGPGGKRFADITGENVNRQMAIVLDDEIVSAPNIQTKISGGTASIGMGSSGSYQDMINDAQELSLVLKSGALPATIQVLEERQVGASLGPELALRGIESILFGLMFVFVFMLFMYKKPGIIACIALGLNGLFLVGLMASFGFALTLPGIAGFILTLGMAVDANVLINERIRQELREGKNSRNAVENGFQKVFWTIMDSNITTMIAALVLLETNSSGPIRGFAVTLLLGLIVSLFTSLYCSKEFFKIALKNKKSDQAIRNWLGNKVAKTYNHDFLKFSKPILSVAIVIAIAAIGYTVAKGGLNWSVDFAGGTEMEIAFEKDVDSDKIRTLAKTIDIKNLELQKLDQSSKKYALRFDRTESDSTEQTASIQTNAQKMQELLMNEFADSGPQIQRVDYVGPKVGRTLRNQGFKSAFLAILGVIAYIFLRFDILFGPGALAKILVDFFMVFAFYAFAWRSFDLTSVAALLTIIGYSVNDTIVIFDRVRENFSSFPKRGLVKNINNAVNETFTRAVNTSITTGLSLIGILIFGTAQIWNFAAAMLVGIISATITSLFISPKLLVWLNEMNEKRKAKAKG